MEWLIELREKKKMSQKELAEQIGISQSALSQIESGKTKPSIETAKAIARVLHFRWTEFFPDE